MLSDEFYQAN